MSRHHTLLGPTLALAAAGVLVLAGCGSSSNATPKASTPATPTSSAPPPPTKLAVAVSAKGVITGVPKTLTAGVYDITETPSGATAEAAVNIVRLSPGYTSTALLTDAGAIFSDKPDLTAVKRLYSKATFVGGPSGFGTQEAMVLLPAGDYAYADPDVDGQPTSGTFTVTGTSTATLPTTATTITGVGDASGSYTFQIDGSLNTTGMVTFKDASQMNDHFLELAKLKPGKTKDACENYDGDPTAAASPCTPVVDGAIISAGVSEVVSYKGLGPGTYILACYMPDPATGKPHAEEGMDITKQVT